MAKVKIIPSTINPNTQIPFTSITKRKVAAYARVSTDSDEQYTSYASQVNYYSKFIKSKSEWEYVDVYADEGITGTSTKKREGFKRMIKDAEEGKIDLIVTKSISRFARNTLDTISTTRKLKSLGIEVYFEKENLWSLDDKAEFLLTIMASMAQEESRSISQNVTLGKRWSMKEGKVSFACKTFLGYKKEDGKIVIDEEQAILVRMIYRMFLVEGKTCSGIAQYLKENKVLTPSGKNSNWTKNTINSILTNEKYKGDALLQKTFTKDYLEHRQVKNEGQLPKFYVENSHPAIIEKENWEQVQTEMQRRACLGASYSSSNIFSTKLICDDCGGFYGKKVWHSKTPFAKEIYQCNRKFSKEKAKCQTPHLTEDEIKEKFIKAYNQAMMNKQQMIEDTNDLISLLTDTTAIDKTIVELTSEIEIISGLVQKMVKENSKTIQDQEEFKKKYDALVKRYDAVKINLDKATLDKQYKLGQKTNLEFFIKDIEKADGVITTWQDSIWMLMVESARVHRNGAITFKFKNGTEVRV